MNTARTRNASLCLLASAGMSTAAANAQPAGCEFVLSNLPTPFPPASEFVEATNLGAIFQDDRRLKAVGFNTGDTAFEFDSARVIVINEAGRNLDLFGGIYANDPDNNDPGEQLAAFAPIEIPFNTAADLIVVSLRTAEPGFVLERNTTYWIVLEGEDNPGEDGLNWTARDPGVAPTPSAGVVFEGYRFDGDDNGTWVNSATRNAVRITACPIPEPDCLADTNGDGELTPGDFNAWVIAFNSQAPACDQNGDGLCSPADFNAWVANFNAGCP
ncbi:MAG: choice-of-anchor R domain-containing protein [Planctomycetota bacterium]